jgi:hypothetical protein
MAKPTPVARNPRVERRGDLPSIRVRLVETTSTAVDFDAQNAADGTAAVLHRRFQRRKQAIGWGMRNRPSLLELPFDRNVVCLPQIKGCCF